MKITHNVLQQVFFPEMPVRISVDVTPRVWTMVTRNDGIWFNGGDREESSALEHADALELRTEFLAANTPGRALEFLNKFHCTWENEYFPDDDDYSYSDFCATQRLMRRIVALPIGKDIYRIDSDGPYSYLERQLLYAIR
jgi:hypothetical protein